MESRVQTVFSYGIFVIPFQKQLYLVTNLGSNDFWVVKLKDNNKPDKEKQGLEVFPNPTFAFANIIVGYDFAGGTATIVDLAGRVLEQFTVSSRTVPIDLSPYPDGIYVMYGGPGW